MNTCDHCHDPIAFIGEDCPCCELKEQLEEAERNLTHMENDKDRAESRVEDLEATVADLQSSLGNTAQNGS